MSQPLFILKSKTHYAEQPNQVRVELEPIEDPATIDFWADPKNPSGRCELYLSTVQDFNFPVGSKFRVSITLSLA
jgi:hypothetical protein